MKFPDLFEKGFVADYTHSKAKPLPAEHDLIWKLEMFYGKRGWRELLFYGQSLEHLRDWSEMHCPSPELYWKEAARPLRKKLAVFNRVFCFYSSNWRKQGDQELPLRSYAQLGLVFLTLFKQQENFKDLNAALRIREIIQFKLSENSEGIDTTHPSLKNFEEMLGAWVSYSFREFEGDL